MGILELLGVVDFPPPLHLFIAHLALRGEEEAHMFLAKVLGDLEVRIV